jgi:hypothetical protein
MPRNDVQMTRFVGVMLDGIREDTPHPPKTPEHPYVTGNLAYNATLMEPLGDGAYRIYVDLDIAPYFPYVLKQRRNYQYFPRAVEKQIRILAENLGGELYRG